MLSLVIRKETFTIKEFLEYEKAHKDTGEYLASRILHDKKLNRMVTFVLASCIPSKRVFAGTASDALGKVDVAGNTFLSIVRKAGYWICLIMCIIEIIKMLLQGNSKAVGNVVIKYLLAFSALYFMPFLFDLIRDIFMGV